MEKKCIFKGYHLYFLVKVILFMGQSLNGFIADKKGREEFISWQSWREFKKFSEKIGCFIFGRNTYKIIKKHGDFAVDRIKSEKIIVSNKKIDVGKNHLANSPKEALNIAKNLGFKKVILVGGSGLNKSFLEKNLIDEMKIYVEPVIVGNGITLFAEGKFEKKLKLISSKKFKSGLIELRYFVKK